METEFMVVLTQYKRKHLEKQLEAVKNQTAQPKYLVVFQNENHVNISPLKEKYNFIHVKSDHNTKFFGRFAYCFTFDVEYCIVMDDDIIPGRKCFEKYISESLRLDGIMGGNGRYCLSNPKRSELQPKIKDSLRKTTEVDFVGHLWCFRKELLYNMFGTKPCTYETGEDMHLCFTCKLKGIKCYICGHSDKEEYCDIKQNKLSTDEYSSYKATSQDLRKNVEDYFIEKGVEMLDSYKIC